MKGIDYLYRYTSLENLALILKNHTIRLNPLDLMDDPQEQRTQDVENIGRFVFISSWTEEAKEDIPMWKMYTDLHSGVRIKLPKNPFKRSKTSIESLSNIFSGYYVTSEGNDKEIDTFMDLAELIRKRIFSNQAWKGEILHQIEYTDDFSLLEPAILDRTGEGLQIKLDKLGKYKNSYWQFEKEWRYILVFTKLDLSSGVENAMNQFNISMLNMSNGTETPLIRHYDLEIAQEYFANIEITPSPQMSIGNRILLETLVEKYNPTAKIRESELKDLL